jgi:hypothetical protein
MGGHKDLFFPLARVIRGDRNVPLAPVDQRGSLNYKLMAAARNAILSPDLRARFVDLLDEQERVGHLTIEGPDGYACEQAAPGMHWTFNAASVTGVYLRVPELREVCGRWIRNEVGLNRAFRLDGKTALPCARLKDERDQPPVDGYRDCWTALALGQETGRGEGYYRSDLAIACWAMAEICRLDLLPDLSGAPVPKLLLPILRKDLPEGGYLAWLEDTPLARRALGRDACNWVINRPSGLSWGSDWEPVPEISGVVVPPPKPEPPVVKPSPGEPVRTVADIARELQEVYTRGAVLANELVVAMRAGR